MDLSFASFWDQLMGNPLLLLAVVLTLGVILVNGWTDAPNAIATCVVTRCMPPGAAILMAAVFNFLGVLLMSMVNATVAETITKMVDFGSNSHEAIVALSAALFAIVVWATAAWYFGIPTSESHALGMDQSCLRPGDLCRYGFCPWLDHLPAGDRPVPQCGPAENGRDLSDRPDRRRRLYELHARSAGRTEVYGRHSSQHVPCKWTGYVPGSGASRVADAFVLGGYGRWHLHRRKEDHQIRGNGYGKAGKIPGLFSGYRRFYQPFVQLYVWYSRFDDPCEDNGHHGRGRGKASVGDQPFRSKGNGDDLDSDVPGLRTDRIFNDKAVYVVILKRRKREYGKQIRPVLL